MKYDPLFKDAARLIVEYKQGSAILIQRKLEIGYIRASKIIDQLEASSIVGPYNHNVSREVLIPDLNTLNKYISVLNLTENKPADLAMADEIFIDTKMYPIIDGVLDLKYKGLESLPENIGDFKRITVIYCEGNSLTSLPESIENLENLTELYLALNLLSSIPDSLGELKKLKILDLSHNLLNTLPESFIKFKRNILITLNGNPIKELPVFFNDFTRLSGIDLSEITFSNDSTTSYSARSLMDFLVDSMREYNYILSKDAGIAMFAYFIYICNQKGQGDVDKNFIQFLVEKVITIQVNRISRETHLTSAVKRTLEKVDFDKVFIEFYT